MESVRWGVGVPVAARTPYTLVFVAELYPRAFEQSAQSFLVLESSLGLWMFLLSDLVVTCLSRYRAAFRILYFCQWSANSRCCAVSLYDSASACSLSPAF
jgi:hypothetical protein